MIDLWNKKILYWMRLIHRYMGYLLIVIMMIYAISGVVLIYRDTTLFKKEVLIEKQLDTGLSGDQLGRVLRIRQFELLKENNGVLYFREGSYDRESGMAKYTAYEYPWLIQEMNKFHLANSKHRYSWLSTVFGIALLFFAVSSFWMFPVKSKIFKKGIQFATIGMLLAIVVLFLD